MKYNRYNKIDKDFVIKEINNFGYTVIGEYINCNKYIDAIQNSTGYKVRVSYSNLKYGKSPIIFGYGNPYCIENMYMYIKNRFPNTEILSNKTITNKKIKVELFEFKCSCGNNFKRKWWDIKDCSYLNCEKCILVKRGLSKRKDKQKVYNLIKKNNLELINNPKDFRRDEKLLVKNKDGYIGYISYNHLKEGKIFSPFRTNVENWILINNINNYCKLNGINTVAQNISLEQKYTKKSINFKCGVCGEFFDTSLPTFLNGKHRCNKCSNSISNIEYKTKKFLEEKGIEFINQFSYSDCRDILPLPFDFYLTDYNMLIEVDGEQYYHDTNGLFNYEYIKKHDKIKNEYCKNKNIPLLRISYDCFNNERYKTIISDFIHLKSNEL